MTDNDTMLDRVCRALDGGATDEDVAASLVADPAPDLSDEEAVLAVRAVNQTRAFRARRTAKH